MAGRIVLLGGALVVAIVAAGWSALGTTATDAIQRAWPDLLRECAVEGFAEPVRCGTVRVAESAANGRQIDLRIIVVPAQTSAPAGEAILPLAGGPGQGAAALAVGMTQRIAWLRDDRDVVLVDQRGTGVSNGLQCPTPSNPAELIGSLFDPAKLMACRDQLAQRADLTQYTTAMAAGDYGRVFDALGYSQVNVIGTSYGTRLGLELARRFPLRIRTLTLEGVVPPDSFNWPTTGAADAAAALDALVDDCHAEAACARAFPRFRQDINLAFARLARDEVTVSVRDPHTGTIVRVPFGKNDLAYATRGLQYGNDALSLPSWFRRAADGDFGAFAQAYMTRARTLDDQIATGVLFGVYCTEDLPFVDRARAEAAAANTYMGTYLLDEYRRACDVWPKGVVETSFRTPVTASVPTLLLSGRRDPVTPPRTAEVVARTLPNARVVIWHHGAHGTDGFATRDCRISIQREFIRSATLDRLPIECMAQSPVLPFRLDGVAVR